MQPLLNFFKNKHNRPFILPARAITPLLHPFQFYSQLVDSARMAFTRISLSSLYIGPGNLQKYLIKQIQNNLMATPTLRVNFLLDQNRSNRYSSNSSGLILLKELIDNNQVGDRVRLGLESPSKFQILGTHHQKIYVFDNKTIISGANLSGNYFTNRQDRYVVIQDEEIADFFHQWITLKINQNQKYNKATGHKIKVNKGKAELLWEFRHKPSQQQFKLTEQKVLRISEQATHKNTQIQLVTNQFCQAWQQVKSELTNAEQYGQVQNIYQRLKPILKKTSKPQSTSDVLLLPIFNPTVEGVKEILKLCNQGKSTLVSGYFNPPKDLQASLQKFDIITASPQVNGFYKSGVKGVIPEMYKSLLLDFSKINQRIYQYKRQEWTFHSKGLWSDLPDGSHLNLIGSTNYSQRSFNRDSQLIILIYTKDSQLISMFQLQLDQIKKHSKPLEKTPPGGYVRLLNKFFAGLL